MANHSGRSRVVGADKVPETLFWDTLPTPKRLHPITTAHQPAAEALRAARRTSLPSSATDSSASGPRKAGKRMSAPAISVPSSSFAAPKRKEAEEDDDSDEEAGRGGKEAIGVKERRRALGGKGGCRIMVVAAFLLLAGAAAGSYFAGLWPLSDEEGISFQGILPTVNASDSQINNLVKLEFDVLLNRKALVTEGAISEAVASLRGNIEESLENFVVQSNSTVADYFAQFSPVAAAATEADFQDLSADDGEAIVLLDECDSSSGAVEVEANTSLSSGVVEGGVALTDLPGLVAGSGGGAATYCVCGSSQISQEAGGVGASPLMGRRRRRLLQRRLGRRSLLDSSSSPSRYLLRDVGVRLRMDVGATQNNLYTLEDKLVMTFESEALHLLLVRDQVVKSVAVSATAEPQDGNGGSRGNGTTIMSGLPLKKDSSEAAAGGSNSKYDDLYQKYLEELAQAEKEGEGNSTSGDGGIVCGQVTRLSALESCGCPEGGNGTAVLVDRAPLPTVGRCGGSSQDANATIYCGDLVSGESILLLEGGAGFTCPNTTAAGGGGEGDSAGDQSPGGGVDPGAGPGNATEDSGNSTAPPPAAPPVPACSANDSVPYGDTFLEFVEAMRQKNEILDAVRAKTGNESVLLTDPLSLDWAKPACAITNHTYYPAILSFGGVDEAGFQQELTCGREYRKYDSKTGVISTVKADNLVAYFYDDGSVESIWTAETDWVFYDWGELEFPAMHEANLSVWTMYEDEGSVEGVSRAIAPRWADVLPCQLYKNFTECLNKAYDTPLKLALVVLHWNDTDPATIDMDLMEDLYANEMMEKYWEGQSYGSMKRMEFETFGPVNININEFYEIGEPTEEIKFCVGEKAGDGDVLVREGGGCGTRGCTYISPNVMSGAYSSFDMTTNISCVPGWRPENFFGTIFLTYSSKGCGGAGLFNSVFSIWIDGKLETLRAISMAHLGPHERCAPDGSNCVSYDHVSGNVEPRYINQTQPEGWEHPLRESNLVETHELIHLFGIYWHSSARKCDAAATDFRECKHREYGNEFSLVGGAGAALELPANERYNLHFLSQGDILSVGESGSFQIGPISSALPAEHRAALIVTDAYSLWLEYRRPVGYDTSLGWEDYRENTEGLMVTAGNHLVDLNRGAPDEENTLFQVTLNGGASWRPFGTNVTISNVVSLGDVGVNFTVTFGGELNSDSYGVS